VPQNAHLNYNSNGWSCNEPYRRNGNQCELE